MKQAFIYISGSSPVPVYTIEKGLTDEQFKLLKEISRKIDTGYESLEVLETPTEEEIEELYKVYADKNVCEGFDLVEAMKFLETKINVFPDLSNVMLRDYVSLRMQDIYEREVKWSNFKNYKK